MVYAMLITLAIFFFQIVVTTKIVFNKYKGSKFIQLINNLKQKLFGYQNYRVKTKTQIVNQYIKCSCCDENIDTRQQYALCNYNMCKTTRDQYIYCKSCINAHISAGLENNKCDFRCMNYVNGCEFVFDHDYISILLNDDILKKFNELIKIEDVQQKAKRIKNYQICPKCQMFGCVTFKIRRYYVCDECKYCWCKDCKGDFHSCDQCGIFKEFKEFEDEAKVRNVIREIMTNTLSHKCPKCDLKYVKEEGCDHITCPSCKAESCYRCGKQYNGHKRECLCGTWEYNRLVTKKLNNEVKKNAKQ